MKKPKNNDTDAVICKRCGKCCLSALVHATDADMERWELQGKEEILRAVDHARVMWAGDIVVSSENEEVLSKCVFLKNEGKYCTCTIYDDRPTVCREFRPGSSELCSQFKKSRLSRI